MEQNKFTSTFKHKLIYIFRINDEAHEGVLKIGEATVHSNKKYDELTENCEDLNVSAKNRINSYTSTAGIKYELLHTEISVKNNGEVFKDTDVHEVLKRSGIEQFFFDTERKQNEWFRTNLETAKNAIKAVKNNQRALNSNEISTKPNPIRFRPEQEKAITETIENFKRSDKMLWNAKMRFGKTLTALELVRRKKFKKTIIITHRPVVNKGWFEDFYKIFDKESNYKFGSKTYGESFNNLAESGNPFIYFASIQDLRGTDVVGGHLKKEENERIFNYNWDLVVIDEAHEGTRTQLGEKTVEGVIKLDDGYTTKVLLLSGTPFNLLSEFESDQVYTWDYIMEQSAKLEWDKEHFGDPNPYADLPEMNIYTYELNKMLPQYLDVQDSAFNFREFFRTWTGNPEIDRKIMPQDVCVGDFVHKDDIIKFLNLLTKKDEYNNYPYSTDEHRNYFRHSLWMLPGVKEAKALSKLLKEHSVFGSEMFEIVNVAGDGDEEKAYKDALEAVKKAIGPNPEETYTITLSCGRLTTGVTVPEWTAVFMLSGNYSTSASSYLQTIFRVQTPAKIGGKVKEKCYVFDFAPDRTLKMVAQAGQLSYRPGSVQSTVIMGEFLNFCPVIAVNGSEMKKYDVPQMLRQLKKAVAQRVVDNGFDDPKIYNDNLLKLNELDLKQFEKLKAIIKSTQQTKKINSIDINKQGFSQEEFEEIEKLEKKPRKQLSEEEIKKLEELKQKKKEAQTAISILRGISIRIPLMIYGADIEEDKDIDCDNFTEIVDDKSWEEFMPEGVTKEIFTEFSKYYDRDIFIAAGKQIRKNAMHADTLPIKQRIQRISEIFSTFKNPDKETVLTPWKTVNMHMGDCIGGYNFNYPDNEPRYINKGNITQDLFNNNYVKILEINSKTGLYALYTAYSVYMNRYLNYNKENYNEEMNNEFWRETLSENIFVICKTKMAQRIVERTLAGFSNYKVNTLLIENIIEELKERPKECIEYILEPKNWNISGGEKMKFDAVVGNPPYQLSVGNSAGNSSKAKAIYNLFFDEAVNLNPQYVSLIMPSRWMTKTAEGISDVWVDNVLSCNKIQTLHDYLSSDTCFPNVGLRGGVCYFLYDNNYNDKCNYYLHETDNEKTDFRFTYLNENNVGIVIRDSIALSIISKILAVKEDYLSNNDKNFSSIVGPKDYFTNKEALTSSWKGFKETQDSEYNIKYYLNKSHNLEYAYVRKKDIPKNHDAIKLHKVYIPAAAGSGNDKNILGKPFYGEPNSVCSQTYLVIGYNKNLTKEECNNIIKYIKTTFFRYLVSIKKKTQNGPKGVYQFVPMQNFKNDSDIDWSKSVKEIDNQLFKKYKLSEDEVDYILSRISYNF